MLTGYYAAWQPTKVSTGASFNLLQSQRLPRRAQVDMPAGKALSSRVRLPVLEFVSSQQTGGLLSHRAASMWREERTGDDRGRGPREEAWPHAVLPQAPCLPSILFILRPCAPRARQRAARITLPAGRAGSADGGPGQASLPALPKGRASGQLPESQRGIGQWPSVEP